MSYKCSVRFTIEGQKIASKVIFNNEDYTKGLNAVLKDRQPGDVIRFEISDHYQNYQVYEAYGLTTELDGHRIREYWPRSAAGVVWEYTVPNPDLGESLPLLKVGLRPVEQPGLPWVDDSDGLPGDEGTGDGNQGSGKPN